MRPLHMRLLCAKVSCTLRVFFFFLNILCYTFLICLLSHFRKSTMKEKKGKYVVSEGKRPKAQL